MSGLREGLRALPTAARRVIGGVTLAAAAALIGALLLDPAAVAVGPVLLIAASIALGEAFGVDIDNRRGSSIRFALGDTAVFAAIAFTVPGNVALGAVLGILIWGLIDRIEPVKLLFNGAQYGLCAGVAAVAVHLVTPDPQVIELRTVAGLALAVVLFIAINTLAMSLVAGYATERSPRALARRLLPVNSLVTTCTGAFAIVVILLWQTAPLALLAMGAPLVLLHIASRAQLSEQRQRDRSEALVETERNLAEARTPPQVARLVIDGVSSTLALSAALWYRNAWLAGAPDDSEPCPLDGDADLWVTTAAEVGLAAGQRPAIAVPFGPGVLVAWEDEIDRQDEIAPWVERLARSARMHLDRAEALLALEQERATLEAVVRGTADGILVLDDGGVVQVWNTAMTTLAGGEEGLGRPVSEALGRGPWQEPGVHDVVRSGRQDDDATIWRVAVSTVEEAGLGRLHVAVVHDVTEERRLAEAKDNMLSVVSHELRTPLTPIKASAQLLSQRADRLDDHQRQRLLHQIEGSAGHLARLVEDLILVAQLSTRSSEPPRVVPATADLVEVIGHEVARAQQALPDHLVILDAPDSLLASTDGLRLQQVVANLLDNAGKFAPPGSTVTVRLAERGDQILLDVADDGPGIPYEDRERVFERFERLEDPMHMRTGGAGLGLFIVRALVRALGGEVRILGEPGEGTTVRVYLPLLDVTAGPVVVEAPPRVDREQEQR